MIEKAFIAVKQYMKNTFIILEWKAISHIFFKFI